MDIGEKLKRKSSIVLGITLLSLSLTGCSSKDLTWKGQSVEKPEDAISNFELNWREALNKSEHINVDKDSRCYFQVQDNAVADTVVCGPVHALGKDNQSWMTAQISGIPTSKGVGLSYNSDEGFSEGDLVPSAELYRPDGKKLDKDLNVPEPAAPEARQGEVVSMGTDGDAPSASTAKGLLVTPVSAIQINNVSQHSRVGGAENRKQAPEGSTFLTFNVIKPSSLEVPSGGTSSDSSSSYPTDAESTDVKYKVKVGGQEFPIKMSPENGRIGVAVPGDGKGAVLTAEYKGLTQEINLDSIERKPSGADGYYAGVKFLPIKSGVSSKETKWEQTPGDDDGQSAEATYSLEAYRTPYLEGYGWAEPGQTLLVVNRSVNGRSATVKSYKQYEAAFTFAPGTLTVDGKKIKQAGTVSAPENSGYGYSNQHDRAVFVVPTTAKNFTLSESIGVSGKIDVDYKGDPGVPDSIDATLPVDDVNFEFETDGRDADPGTGDPIQSPKKSDAKPAPTSSSSSAPSAKPSSSSSPSASASASSSTSSGELKPPVSTGGLDTSDTECVGAKRRYTQLRNVDCYSAKYVADNVLANGKDIAPNARQLEDYTCYAPTKTQRDNKDDVPPRVCVKDGNSESFEIWPKAGGGAIE